MSGLLSELMTDTEISRQADVRSVSPVVQPDSAEYPDLRGAALTSQGGSAFPYGHMGRTDKETQEAHDSYRNQQQESGPFLFFVKS